MSTSERAFAAAHSVRLLQSMAKPLSAVSQLPRCSVQSRLACCCQDPPRSSSLPATRMRSPVSGGSVTQHFHRQYTGTCLEIGVVKLEPLNGPGGTTWGAWAILCVLGLVLAKARPGGFGTAQGVGTCRQRGDRASAVQPQGHMLAPACTGGLSEAWGEGTCKCSHSSWPPPLQCSSHTTPANSMAVCSHTSLPCLHPRGLPASLTSRCSTPLTR